MWLRDQIAKGLGVEPNYVERLAGMASTHYRMGKIPKRTGGTRTIWMPSPELKAAQRWLVRRLIGQLPVHDAAAAYERGSTIRGNANRHVASKYLLRIDFRKFFESITRADVATFIHTAGKTVYEDWSSDDTDLFVNLVCWRTHLVIGAVTSPALTNRMCLGLDQELEHICETHQVTYSRYADDLFFSARSPGILQQIEDRVNAVVDALAMPASLTINKRKTRHLSKRNRRMVTGLVLTCEGEISLGRKRKRKIRALVDQFEALGDAERKALQGTIAFCRDVEPRFVDRLALKYGARRLETILSWVG